MPDERTLDLEAERLAADEYWRTQEAGQIPLAVAAAIAFHQVHGNTRTILTREDYDDALNIAATAISRLIAVYAVKDPRDGRVPLAIDLTKARFTRGATELQWSAGGAMRGLTVVRGDFTSALSLIKRTGLPFSFAVLPAMAEETPAKPVVKKV
jgi:hypothetical protein